LIAAIKAVKLGCCDAMTQREMTMSDTQMVLDPVAPVGVAADSATFRPLATLAGKVVAFIDNSKPNFSLLADDLGELLMAKYGENRQAPQVNRFGIGLAAGVRRYQAAI
jgi:hypothetical protein